MRGNRIIFIAIGAIIGIGVAFFFSSNVYADQPPPLVASIQNNPYYFAEGDLGINMLRYFNAPLTPYLTEGVTDKSTNKEIMDAYYKTNSNITSSVVEQHSDRAISYVLHIESPEIFSKNGSDNKVASFNFQLFNPETNPYQFTLESLASKDNQKYYEFASRYINPGKRPDLFDATIDVVTGDGTVLQKWQYFYCSIAYFETYLQNNLTFLMFAGGMEPEIRDHSQFECRARYMQADMEHIRSPYTNFHGTTATKTYDPAKLGKIPSTDDRGISYLVSFVGREIPEEVTFQTFGQFGPLGQTIPQYYPYAGGLELNPQFYLESLLSKDKKGYYEYISRYINAGKTPERFDVKVDIVTGDGTALLRWQYFDCKVTNFEAYLQDSVLIIKFHPGPTPEIRDRTEFQCAGTHLEADFEVLFSPYYNIPNTGDARLVAAEPGAVIPKDADRATSFVVHFANGDFNTTKTIRTFAKFEQTALTEFNLQSLPSQDKNELYDVLIAKSMNPGRPPYRFDVTVDIVSGDGIILQKWQYYKCIITNYQSQLNDNLLGSRFVGKSVTEIRDKTSFECQGQDLVADPLKPVSPYTSVDVASPTLNPTSDRGGEVPKDESRAMSYVVHLVGADIPQETFTSFASFETHGITVKTAEGSLVYNKEKPAFVLESLPSKDKLNFYLLLAKYVNPGKEPDPFDVTVDIVSGDNTILQSWKYLDCQIVNYEAFLEDALIMIKYNPSPAAEIRDTAGFVCVGFHFETPRLDAFSPYANIAKYGEKRSSDEKGSVVPNDNDRPMSYVVHLSGGDIIVPHTFLTFSKYKQMGKTQFSLESLPSQDRKGLYDLFQSRYINPGSRPQLFDVSIDLVTGDGTVLQSWQHHKCAITDYVIYRDDNLLLIRFDTKPNSEIRTKSTFDCGGLNVDIEEKLPFSPDTDIFKKGMVAEPKVPGIVVPPHSQAKSGLSTDQIICNERLELMYRPSTSLPYCVKGKSVAALQERGWEYIGKRSSEKTTTDEPQTEPTTNEPQAESTFLKGVVPNIDERAMSFKVNVIGTEVPEVIHQMKFSKFGPFTLGDITIPTAKILGIPIPETATISLHPGVSVGNQTMTFDVTVGLDDLPLPIPTATIAGDTSTLFGVIPYYQFGDAPSFYLESLPAKDKTEFYKWVSRYVNPGKTPDPIDVGIQFFDGSGNLLQTWIYRDCTVISYQIFLEENILMIKYHEQWQNEIKDRVMFSCVGLSLNEL